MVKGLGWGGIFRKARPGEICWYSLAHFHFCFDIVSIQKPVMAHGVLVKSKLVVEFMKFRKKQVILKHLP